MEKKYHIWVENIVLEKEKLLVTSNFSFSHNVFHSYICLVRQNAVWKKTKDCEMGRNSIYRAVIVEVTLMQIAW